MELRLVHSGPFTAPVARAVPVPVLALATVPVALDLLAQVQHAPLLGSAALAGCAATGLGLVPSLLRRPRSAWLWATVLAFVASVALRLAGMAEGPALGVLGVFALGLAGSFTTTIDASLDEPALRESVPIRPSLPEMAEEPAPLPSAA